jgi:hypothetical protein
MAGKVMSDTPRTDEVHRVAMSLVVGDDYSTAHDEMLLHARRLERELAEYKVALRRLMKEAAATAALAEPQIRDICGHTNFECLINAINEAGAVHLAGNTK